MTQDSALQYLDGIFADSCIALFQYQESPITPTRLDDLAFDGMVAACVDGGSEEFEVVLTLNMPFSALAMTYPVATITQTSEDELEDWASELANRLLGKFNDRLAKVGHRMDVGLPQREIGVEFIQAIGEGGQVCIHDFEIDGELFRATMQIELLKNEIFFDEQQAADNTGVGEGELELF